MKTFLKIIGIFYLLCISAASIAQQYNCNLIPDSLKNGADAIVRLDETTVTVKNIHKTVIKSKTVITILNEEGDRFARYYGYYDKFRSISDISGVLYDANGNKIKSIKKKDIADLSVSDGFSLMTDARTKQFAFYHKIYPYTVEFEDEVEYEGTYNIPSWIPINAFHLAIQSSTYTLQTPQDFKVNHKQFNYVGSPKESIEKDKKTLTWQVTNLKAIYPEAFMPEWREITPTVYFSPEEFELGGYKGSTATWKDFGLFSKQLNAGRDELPTELISAIHIIADPIKDTRQKIEAVYDYVQKNTRYISVQLGIGGLQPFEAKYVANKKYGDCKALSNFTVSLLKEVGIKAYYTLIAAGEDESKRVIPDFPRDYFNHIVACVPNGQDTIWLECTSQTKSAGYMGTFTGNRKALMIGDDGGYLVQTPIYQPKDSKQIRKVQAIINAEGTLISEVKTTFTGIQQELAHRLKHDFTEDDRKKYLNRVINLPTFSVEQNEYKEIKGIVPVMEEYLKISSSNYANITSKRLFVTPNLFNRNNKLSNDKTRQFDIEYDYAFQDIDTIFIKIPDGYVVEAMPKDIKLSNKFGNYTINFAFKDNQIEMIRFYERGAGKYLKSDFSDMVKFYDEMYKADRSKMVLVKKEG